MAAGFGGTAMGGAARIRMIYLNNGATTGQALRGNLMRSANRRRSGANADQRLVTNSRQQGLGGGGAWQGSAAIRQASGGRGGIRTPPEPFGSAVFKTAAIDHSATLPGNQAISPRTFPVFGQVSSLQTRPGQAIFFHGRTYAGGCRIPRSLRSIHRGRKSPAEDLAAPRFQPGPRPTD